MKVPIGFATLLGTIGAIAAVLIPFIGELADAAQPLGVDPQVWVVVAAVLTSVVVIGRMAQAALALRAADVIAEPVPTEGGALEPPV